MTTNQTEEPVPPTNESEITGLDNDITIDNDNNIDNIPSKPYDSFDKPLNQRLLDTIKSQLL